MIYHITIKNYKTDTTVLEYTSELLPVVNDTLVINDLNYTVLSRGYDPCDNIIIILVTKGRN
jgi:hypothetical protein